MVAVPARVSSGTDAVMRVDDISGLDDDDADEDANLRGDSFVLFDSPGMVVVDCGRTPFISS
jgi:hypothetical protein